MCTGFIHKGNDILFCYNLDIDPEVWNFKLIKNKNIFTVAITVGKTTYYTHGVNKYSKFACLPYMNDSKPFRKLAKAKRIDILVDRFLRNKPSFDELKNIALNSVISNVKFGSLHSLIGDVNRTSFIIEPGCKTVELINSACITNYPLLKECNDNNDFYGKDRFKTINDNLSINNIINHNDAIKLLQKVAQKGKWATRISFVYSKNNNCVYYILNNDGKIRLHNFL